MCHAISGCTSDKQAIKFTEERETAESWNTTSKTSAVDSALLYGWELYFFVVYVILRHQDRVRRQLTTQNTWTNVTEGIVIVERKQYSSPCASNEGRWGSGGTEPLLLELGITLVNSMTRPLCYLWNIRRQPLNTRRLGPEPFWTQCKSPHPAGTRTTIPWTFCP